VAHVHAVGGLSKLS